ncbi:uncharacterized protein LOC120417004 [Culex pipiens pallens]|uniref:uncharacterized protein LOC120417004 n=1 Tax=Culex pipiens pallens TaxID=42434 RepID=UPI001954EA20|nr:uncharacterized protein LOC120417004 [Culex pipiens pallens]
MRNRLPVLVVVLGLLVWRPISSNFVAYDDDHELNGGDDQEYLQDADHQRPPREDYHDALDRLITHALNQTHPSGDSPGSPAALVDSKVTAASPLEVDEEPPKCAANRQPIPISPSTQLSVAKCCPEGQTFLHESIVKCKSPLRKIRLPIISRRVHLYDSSCYHFGAYLKPNVTFNGRCIGKRLVFNDGALFTVIQNGSLMVSSPEQMAIYRDFCLEETASSVLVAYVCDELVYPDPFDWVDKLVIGTALVVLFLTVLLYGFERNFHCVFGKLIMVHVGLLFTALLLEAALTEFEEAFYSLIVYTLIGASYVIFAAANLHNLIANQASFQKMDSRNVAYVAFGCCLLWLASVLFTLYCDEKIATLCTVFAALLLSVLVNVITLRGIVSRRHHLLTAADNFYDISDGGGTESTTYLHHRKELTILATFAALVQVLHWALYAAGRYNLLYGLSWCGLTVFAVFVCFRYRSITVLFCTTSGGGSRKVLRHHHHQDEHQQQQQAGEDTPPSSILQLAGQDQPRPPPISTSSPYYSQLTSSATSQYYHHHQQENQDNQKHMALPPVAEEEGGDEGRRTTTSNPFS